VRDLRDRVHRLAEIVGDDAVPADPKPKKHKKNKHGKKKGKQGET
jgi:hypothetical protein